jgi:hypothetical protein
MKSTARYFRIDRREIGFFKFILEACDGVATLSTMDSELGLVSLSIPPGRESEVNSILDGLKGEIFFEPYDET